MYNNTGGQPSPSRGIRFSFLTPTDQAKFEQIFSQGAAAFGGNKISAQAVSELLRRSNLDNDSLAKIWDLASIANAPHLTFPEFAVAMFLTSKKLTGQQLPASLPPNIREETEVAMATIASTETPSPSQQLVNTSIPQQQQQFQQQLPMMTGMPTGMMMQQQQAQPTGMLPQQQLNMMTGRPTPPQLPQLPMQTGMQTSYMGNYQAPMQTGMTATAFLPQPPVQQQHKPRLQNLEFAKKMMPNQNGVTNLLNPHLGTSDANRLSWKISPEDKQRYRDIFNAWEGSGSGFMSGETAKDVLTQSQLPPQDLQKIWNLADSENKGSLDLDEFSVAMHLVYRKLNGFEIPTALPAELKPPSSLLKKFVLGRRPPPTTVNFTQQTKKVVQEEEDDYTSSYGNHQEDYVSSARRKGPQSASSSRYAPSSRRYDVDSDDEVDVVILEDLRRQISETKRALDRIPVPPKSFQSSSSSSNKYSLEELKEKIRRTQEDLNYALRTNPLSNKYVDNSETLLDLMETEKSLQDEINYLINRDIPVLARQLRGAAAELRDAKVRHSRKNDGTQDFMAFITPTGPGGSITESDRVRAKAKAMMAARKSGNNGAGTADASFTLRRAEEEKEEADRKADAIERDMERSRTALLDMRGDLKYLEEMTAAQDLEDKKRFDVNGGSQDLSYELRRFIEMLDSKVSESPSSYRGSASGYRSSSSTPSGNAGSGVYQSPSVASPSLSNTSSPKPKAPAARPRTAEEIRKEAERRVQERLAALQAKRNPGASPRSVASSTPSTPPVSKPDEAEVAAQQRLRDAEREAQDMLRQSVSQREETDRKNREAELERIREGERLERQRQQDLQDQGERERKEQEEDEKRRQQEEYDLEERRRQILAKEEADRQARFDAIRREEEAEEAKKNASKQHKPEDATPPPPPPAPPAPPAPAVAAATSPPVAPPAPETPSAASTSSNNPFAKLQQQQQQQQQTTSPVGSSQAEKPNEAAATTTGTAAANKRVSYNPFATFSAFSATKASKNDSDSEEEEEDDGWDVGHDDSEDENEFPAAGSAKNLAGMLFSAMSKRGAPGLEPVRETSSPKPDTDYVSSSIPAPPSAPPTAAPPPASNFIPPPPPAPVAPAAPAGDDSSRNALLSQIQLGTKLKKAVTNDRSSSAIAGKVIGGNDNEPSVKPAPTEIVAPAPIAAPLSSGNFLTELQARTNGASPSIAPGTLNEEPVQAVAAALEPIVVEHATHHDESLPEHEYIAIWDYPGSGADDLAFVQDDIILIRDTNESEDWWFGTLEKTGKTGYFPRNYVQPKPEPVPELNIKAKALYDFDGPEGQDYLSFKMGDNITILVKESDDWWKAKSEDGSRVGLVPANYLEEL